MLQKAVFRVFGGLLRTMLCMVVFGFMSFNVMAATTPASVADYPNIPYENIFGYCPRFYTDNGPLPLGDDDDPDKWESYCQTKNTTAGSNVYLTEDGKCVLDNEVVDIDDSLSLWRALPPHKCGFVGGDSHDDNDLVFSGWMCWMAGRLGKSSNKYGVFLKPEHIDVDQAAVLNTEYPETGGVCFPADAFEYSDVDLTLNQESGYDMPTTRDEYYYKNEGKVGMIAIEKPSEFELQVVKESGNNNSLEYYMTKINAFAALGTRVPSGLGGTGYQWFEPTQDPDELLSTYLWGKHNVPEGSKSREFRLFVGPKITFKCDGTTAGDFVIPYAKANPTRLFRTAEKFYHSVGSTCSISRSDNDLTDSMEIACRSTTQEGAAEVVLPVTSTDEFKFCNVEEDKVNSCDEWECDLRKEYNVYMEQKGAEDISYSDDESCNQKMTSYMSSTGLTWDDIFGTGSGECGIGTRSNGGEKQYEIDHVCVYDKKITSGKGEDCEPGTTHGECKNPTNGCRYVATMDAIIPARETGDKYIYIKVKEYNIDYHFGENDEGKCATPDGCPKKYSNLLEELSVDDPISKIPNAYDFTNWCLYYKNCEDPDNNTSAEDKNGFECTLEDNPDNNPPNYTSDFSFEHASDVGPCSIDAYAVFEPITHYVCYKDDPNVIPADAESGEDPCLYFVRQNLPVDQPVCALDDAYIGNCGDYNTNIDEAVNWQRVYNTEGHMNINPLPTPTKPAFADDGLGWKFNGWVKADGNLKGGWSVDCSKQKITKTDGIYNEESYLVLGACWEKLMGSVKFVCGKTTSYTHSEQVGTVIPWDARCGDVAQWYCSSQDNDFEVDDTGVKLGSDKLVTCRPSYGITYHNPNKVNGTIEDEIKYKTGDPLTPNIHALGYETYYPDKETMNEKLGLLDVRPGYMFTGWHYGSPTGGTATSRLRWIPGSVKVYASWEPFKYTINFDKNGGTGMAMPPMKDVTVENATTKLTPNTFTKARSSFLGWCVDNPTCEDIVEDEALVVDLLSDAPNKTTLTLYAQWDPIPYKVVFDDCGNDYIFSDMPDDIETDTNKSDTLPLDDVICPGHIFKGWCLANSEATDCANDEVFSAGAATNGLVDWNNIYNSPGVTIDSENDIIVTVCPKWEDKGTITCEPGYYLPYKLGTGADEPRNDVCQSCVEATDIGKPNIWCPGLEYTWNDADTEEQYNDATNNGGIEDCYGNQSEDLTECKPSYTVTFKKCDATGGVSPTNISTYLGEDKRLPENNTLKKTGYEFDAWCLADNNNGSNRKCVLGDNNRFDTGQPTDSLIDWDDLFTYIPQPGVSIDTTAKTIEIRVCPIWKPKTFDCAAGEYFPYSDPSDPTKRNTECRACEGVGGLDGKYCPSISYTWVDGDTEPADFDDGSDQCPDDYLHSDGDRNSESSCYKEVQEQCSEIVPCPDHATCAWNPEIGTVTARQYYGIDSLVVSEETCEMTFDCDDNYHKDEANKQCLREYTVSFKKCGVGGVSPTNISTYLGEDKGLPGNNTLKKTGYEFDAWCLADNKNGSSRKCVPGSNSFVVGSLTDELIDWDDLNNYTPQTGVVIDSQGAITINVCPTWKAEQYNINYYNYKNESLVADDAVWSETVNYTIEDYGTGSTKHPISLITPSDVYGYDFKGWCVYSAQPDEDEDVEDLSDCDNPTFVLEYDEVYPENSVGDRWVYAMWTPKKIQCSAGHYIETESDNCEAECPENSYCPGNGCSADDSDCGTDYDGLEHGATKCPSEYQYSDGGEHAVNVAACYAKCPEDTHYKNTGGRIYAPAVDGGDPNNQCTYEFVCPSSGRWLHIGEDKLCLDRYLSDTTGPMLVVALRKNSGDGIKKYYARLSENENMTINKDSTKKLRISVGTKIYNVYDASFDPKP